MNDEQISPILDERSALLHELIDELQVYGKMTNQSMQTEIELISEQSDFWEICNLITSIVEQIESQIKSILESQEDSISSFDEQYHQLENQHSTLENDLQNAKMMSRSIATKASIIRNKRISPILTLLWSMTSKSFNAEQISKYNDLYDVLFQFIEKAENTNSNMAVLGILVNISSSYQGIESLVNAIHRSPIPFFKKLLNSYELLLEPRVKQLVLYLIKNIAMCDKICIDLIREGCIKFCSDYLDQLDMHSVQYENDFQIIIDILDTLLDMKYVKTLNFYSQKEIRQLYSRLKNFGEPDLKILAKIKNITDINEDEQPMKPKRFGVKRIYS